MEGEVHHVGARHHGERLQQEGVVGKVHIEHVPQLLTLLRGERWEVTIPLPMGVPWSQSIFPSDSGIPAPKPAWTQGTGARKEERPEAVLVLPFV